MSDAARLRSRWARRLLLGGLLVAVVLVSGGSAGAAPAPGSAATAPAGCSQGALSKQEAIDQLRDVRDSIDRTLRLLDAGAREAAFDEARTGYLDCFEAVEAPLDIVAGTDFRFEVEEVFARVRGLIDSGAGTGEVRDRIVTLRGLIDESERQLTATGFGAPALMFGQSFTLLLREGLEAVLLLSVLLTYLESSEHARHRKPVLVGVVVAVVATVITFFAVDALFSVLPFGREVLEAVVGLLAVAMLFYVSFWLIARLDQRRRMEFLQARVWKAASVGSAASLALVGFTAVYREGVETVLFYQALFSFGRGLRLWILLGMLAGGIVLAGVAWSVLKLGRKLPVRRFLTAALVIVMLSSVAVLGNAMRALQEAAVIDLRVLDGWPHLPIFLAQATGYFPTGPSVVAQAILLGVYVVGGVVTYGYAARRRALAVAPGGGRLVTRRVRIGVDVGGTFTKAVAIGLPDGALLARAVVPTTHTALAGPAAGVVEVVAEVAHAVGADRVELITYSTTQAVNALLEGDVAVVGVLGLGRQPDLRKAAKRTRLDRVELSPGRRLPTVHELLDITRGLDEDAVDAALDRLEAGGATTVCVAEAFAPDGGEDERRTVQLALARGLPACGSAEMTGLYGLELRTVTAALNASVLPIAMRTEEHVEKGVTAAGIDAPIMVMRGDGGATDPAGLRREPARALYSGPAASVAGVLRHERLVDGIVLEVGGTSTNVAAVRGGRPDLSYVQVASHATAVRAIDVRVVGVAGGSLLRARKGRFYGVGPRSAHIAGLPYACYLPADRFVGARAELIAPRPGRSGRPRRGAARRRDPRRGHQHLCGRRAGHHRAGRPRCPRAPMRTPPAPRSQPRVRWSASTGRSWPSGCCAPRPRPSVPSPSRWRRSSSWRTPRSSRWAAARVGSADTPPRCSACRASCPSWPR